VCLKRNDVEFNSNLKQQRSDGDEDDATTLLNQTQSIHSPATGSVVVLCVCVRVDVLCI